MSREIPSKPSLSPAAFSLLEMLVAMAVLSIMMAFLFNLVAQTMRAWEGGSRQVEAAQAARLGLETMADDLQFAFGGSAVAPILTAGGAGKTNIVPFFSKNNATDSLGVPAELPLAPSSGQIFAVAPLASADNMFHEVGYMSVYVTRATTGEGYGSMRGRRYYLLRHAVHATNSGATGVGNFFYANALPPNQAAAGQWLSEAGDAVFNVLSGTRTPLIPNCYQLKLSYASNSGGVLSFSDQWTAADKLPAGVLITAKVMDEKTAARIASLQSNGLTAADVADGSATTVGRILREGTVEVHRFVPFVNARR
jgi:prepilin-type N-terminal cleavage/methylation domain-containing protein